MSLFRSRCDRCVAETITCIAVATVPVAIAWNFADFRRYINIDMM
jgi:hypothetical protein